MAKKKQTGVVKPKREPRRADDNGLRCPQCWSPLNLVIWTRAVAGVRIRLRACIHCGTRFRTTERTD